MNGFIIQGLLELPDARIVGGSEAWVYVEIRIPDFRLAQYRPSDDNEDDVVGILGWTAEFILAQHRQSSDDGNLTCLDTILAMELYTLQ